MRGRPRRAEPVARALVFRGPVRVPVPSRAAVAQAARGGAAEFAVYAALHPLDGLVLRATLRAPGAAGGAGSLISRVRLFCVPSLVRTAGGAALGTATFALAYAMLREQFRAAQSPARVTAAAALASALSTAVDAPLRAAGTGSRVGRRTGMRHALGMAARDVPADALEFGAYELFRGAASSPASRCIAGALGGALSTLLVAPLDVALVQMIAAPRSGGLLSAVRHVLRSSNRKAVFAGVGERCFREAMASALFFCMYEAGQESRGEDDPRGEDLKQLSPL